MTRLTPHQRIMRAYDRCGGVRLSADDVTRLGEDDAIATRAQRDDEEQEKRKRKETRQR